MKTCSRCHREREDDDYHRNARSRDGLHWYCRTCRSNLAGYSPRVFPRSPDGLRDLADYLDEEKPGIALKLTPGPKTPGLLLRAIASAWAAELERERLAGDDAA